MEALWRDLETKIRTMLDQQARLKEASNVLTHEKESLLNKQKQAIAQIENLISKLKTIEKMP